MFLVFPFGLLTRVRKFDLTISTYLIAHGPRKKKKKKRDPEGPLIVLRTNLYKQVHRLVLVRVVLGIVCQAVGLMQVFTSFAKSL
jgi:hypothetical protein